MWEKRESKEQPNVLDETSSRVYNYVRKNIHTETRTVEGVEETFYVYDEQKIRKEDWDTYETVIRNEADIADVTDALVELAALIG